MQSGIISNNTSSLTTKKLDSPSLRSNKYSLSILNKLASKDLEISQKFLFKLTEKIKSENQIEGFTKKSAIHQTLNQLIIEGLIILTEVKQIVKAAWFSAFKSRIGERSTEKSTHISSHIQGRRLVSPTNGTPSLSIKPPSGFLWKPIAESPPNGLVVLLPPPWTGSVIGVDVLDPISNQLLASGKEAGVGNGGRQHFRFSQKGQDFPNGAYVKIEFTDGTTKIITVANSSARFEVR